MVTAEEAKALCEGLVPEGLHCGKSVLLFLQFGGLCTWATPLFLSSAHARNARKQAIWPRSAL